MLIGQAGDLRSRIKQYVTGTQPRGNLYWREDFLTQGDMRLFVLRVLRLEDSGDRATQPHYRDGNLLVNKNLRLLLEQLLLRQESSLADNNTWLVNRDIRPLNDVKRIT